MKLHIKRPQTKTLLLPLVVVAVLVVSGFSIASYEKNKQKRDKQEAQVAAAQVAHDQAVHNQIVSLQTSVTSEQTKRKAVCDYVTALSTQKATRSLVTVPVVPCSFQ